MARKPNTPVITDEFIVGAETGYAVRNHLANASQTVKNTTLNTTSKVRGFFFGLIGPKEPKPAKVREVRMTPELQRWLAARQK